MEEKIYELFVMVLNIAPLLMIYLHNFSFLLFIQDSQKILNHGKTWNLETKKKPQTFYKSIKNLIF